MQVDRFNFALKWALIISGIGILLNLPQYLSGPSDPTTFSTAKLILPIFGLFIQIIVMTIAIIKYARANEHKVTPRDVWIFGGLVVLINLLLSAVISVLFIFVMGENQNVEGMPTFSESLEMMASFYGNGILVLMFLAILLFIFFAFLAAPITIAGQWRTYEKGGKPGWACIVPIYNYVCIAEIGKQPTWWIIMLFIPLVNIVFAILLIHAFVKSFGKDAGWTVGLIFLPFIFYPMLAWGDAQYQFGDFENTDLNVEDHLVE